MTIKLALLIHISSPPRMTKIIKINVAKPEYFNLEKSVYIHQFISLNFSHGINTCTNLNCTMYTFIGILSNNISKTQVK